MDTLPYFIQLIKHNILLSALIISGDSSKIDLKGVQHDRIGQMLQIFNFPLSENDKIEQISFFSQKDICSKKDGTIITLIFTTKDPKYFLNPGYYFNYPNNVEKDILPYQSDSLLNKDLGMFKIFENPTPPALVNIINNPQAGGYNIYLRFYSDFDRIIETKNKLKKLLKNTNIKFKDPIIIQSSSSKN